MTKIDLKSKIRDIPNFPKVGVIFKDITTLLKNAPAFLQAIEEMAEYYRDKNIELVAGIESRGFIFGSALAYRLGAGFVPIRKFGKLPAKTLEITYELEYGKDQLCIHEDAITDRQNVLLVDDLLATGGTAAACLKLLEQQKANIVGVAFLIELTFLNGAEKLRGYDIFSLVKF